MKEVREVFVIYNPYNGGYYDGIGFKGILFAKSYHVRASALDDVDFLLKSSNGITYLKIEKFYTYL